MYEAIFLIAVLEFVFCEFDDQDGVLTGKPDERTTKPICVKMLFSIERSQTP